MSNETHIGVRLEKVYLSFPHLYEKHAPPGTQNYKYRAEFILDPTANADTVAKVNEAYENVLKAAGKGGFIGKIESPMQEGTKMNDAAEMKGRNRRPEIDGKYVIRTSSNNPPGIATAQRQPIPEASKDMIFGGCLVNGFINVYWHPKGPNPGVYAGLQGVQLLDNVNTITITGGAGPMAIDDMFDAVEGAPAPQQPAPGGAGPAPVPPSGDMPDFM